MCDACKGLAFLELEGLTERQMDAARTLLCPADAPTLEEEYDRGYDDGFAEATAAAERKYAAVYEQHAKLAEQLDRARQMLMDNGAGAWVIEPLDVLGGLIEALPTELA